jgi:hypothetical protein
MQLGDIGLGLIGRKHCEGDPKLVERCTVAPKVPQLKTTSDADLGYEP